MSNTAAIGPRVRAARKRLGQSREALAFHSGLSWSAIAQVESGRRRNLRPDTLSALSRTLEVSIDYLVGGTQAPATMLDHSALVYGTEGQFRTTIGPFLAEGIERSEAVLAVTTAPNIVLLRDHLGQDARHVEFIEARSFYGSPISAVEGFRAFAEAKLAAGAAWIRVVGEPTWGDGSPATIRAWARYESLFNLIFAPMPLTVVCPHDERSLRSEIVRQAHLTHPHLMSCHGTSPSPDFADPQRFTLEPA